MKLDFIGVYYGAHQRWASTVNDGYSKVKYGACLIILDKYKIGTHWLAIYVKNDKVTKRDLKIYR